MVTSFNEELKVTNTAGLGINMCEISVGSIGVAALTETAWRESF